MPAGRLPDGGTPVGQVPDGADRVVVLNPSSGDGEHGETVRRLAAEHGFAVVETAAEGDGVALAEAAAASGAGVVAAAGGDGTVNEVVRGVDRAGAFEGVTLGVVPAGTGNNFAGNVGVTGVEEAFEVMERGRTRRIDVGAGDGRLFVNSCVAGLTAEASADTSAALKERFGVLAYVLATLRAAADFEGFPLSVEAAGESEPAWSGEALLVLVGNARRFGAGRQVRADAEDGQFDVTVVDAMPPTDLLGDAALGRLLAGEREYLTRFRAPALAVDVSRPEPVPFSFDGEMERFRELSLRVMARTLRLFVGESYRPDAGEDEGPGAG